MIRSQKDLAVQLSKLEDFAEHSLELEQYSTSSDIAAEWVWSMALRGEIAGKVILDAAAGPGIIGMGLLLMGAKKVIFVDKDENAMQICMRNFSRLEQEYEIGEAEFIVEDVRLFDSDVDIVAQNPPFGTQEKHIDKVFLEKAFSVSTVVYSMHKWSTKSFVEGISKDNGFSITNVWRFSFPIKKQFLHHKKPVQYVDVGLWRMEKL